MLLSNSLAISHEIIKRVVKQGDTVVDATMGNGNDTLLLAGLVGEKGKVYSFDIQEAALKNTEKKLREAGVSDIVELICDGHQNIDNYVPNGIRAVMFNLGYLPKGYSLTNSSNSANSSLYLSSDNKSANCSVASSS
jgi:ubiquinone/menaquinone biosynthesis C-methylase UbiE